MSVVDTSIDRIHRSAHARRLQRLYEARDDHAYAVASTFGFRRATYANMMAEHVREAMAFTAAEPLRKLLG